MSSTFTPRPTQGWPSDVRIWLPLVWSQPAGLPASECVPPLPPPELLPLLLPEPPLEAPPEPLPLLPPLPLLVPELLASPGAGDDGPSLEPQATRGDAEAAMSRA